MTDYGFFRVAACVPHVQVGRAAENAIEIVRMASEAAADGARAICFPELCLTGCTLGDLVHNEKIRSDIETALAYIREKSAGISSLLVIGTPLNYGDAVLDAYAAIRSGSIVGFAVNPHPSDIRNYAQPITGLSGSVRLCGEEIPVMQSLTVHADNATLAIQASGPASVADADIVFLPSGYTEIAGRTAELKSLVTRQSADMTGTVVLASAGHGESTTDALYAGHALIASDGTIIAERHRTTGTIMADIDIQSLREARKNGVPASCSPEPGKSDGSAASQKPEVCPSPFITGPEVFEETFYIQTASLITRLEHTGIRKLVIGISGGLDSTLALLVCVNATDLMGISRKDITGITMPGFGTTDRTYTNAVGMMKSLGIEWREINIREAALLHMRDIGHDPDIHDSAYENTQARERTQILMDVANEIGALVVGTGDLSELALGWCTYNGDHMSMYAINASVPKTLIPGIISYAADMEQFSAARGNLLDVIATPISPELLPADSQGNIVQKTEDIIGPYELHDFFIYHFIHSRFAPDRILQLATTAFAGKYDEATISKWLNLFLKRFFNNQFKRSCMPDGPCCGAVSLSPRGGWQMPSDISLKLR
ncbi:MAG: NAD(+) synthase [Bacteroidaceae bacterium]|nr:NAD(+) synthase [Bacteroidaceae bacterium]